MKKNYPYLKDANFLKIADEQKLQNQFIKLIVLDWNENPIEEIQGIATGGTISNNGNSAIRRTCNLTMTVKESSTGKITDTRNLISLNKKVYVEIGIKNTTNQYKEYPILWYPQGTMVVTQCSISTGLNQGITLSAQLKDKMCLLNGECGGVITSAVIFDHYDTLEDTTGKMITIQPTIAQIIRELVNHFGGEQLGKIIINDIDEKAKMVMKWTGDSPIYLADSIDGYLFTTNEEEALEHSGTIREFNYGQDIGFIYTDFIWPKSSGELSANSGDNVCTILDKIKNFLGNYEYYYDIDGNFIFQEIKNYLNTTKATVDLRNMNNRDYQVDIANGKSVYDFTNNKLAISFSHNPQYNRIKNDYVVWGIKENDEKKKLPIRYHLAIDNKPETGNIYEVFFYDDPSDGLRKAKCPVKYENISHFPDQGAEGVFYLDQNTGMIYKWDGDKKLYVALDGSIYDEYNTPEDFPEVGTEGVIYTSTSDGKLYSWKIVPGSLHYNTIAAQITALTSDYEANLRPYNEAIAAQEEIIADCNARLEEAQTDYVKWLTKEKQFNKEIDSLNTQVDEKEQEIAELETKRDAQQTIVNLRNEEIIIIDAELNGPPTPTPERRDELLQRKSIAILERDAAQQYVDNYQLDIDKDVADVEELNAQIVDIEFVLIPVEQQLIPYYEIKDEIDTEIAEAEEEIQNNKDEMAELETQYLADKEELLAAQGEYVSYTGESLVLVQATDWRSELYLSGAATEPLGLNSNYYYAELASEWPKLYDLQADSYVSGGRTIYTGAFKEGILENPWDVDYWLDFIDSGSTVSQFNISNIGRRSVVKNSDDYNCVFEAEVPDIIIIEADQTDTPEKRAECDARGQDYCQVSESIYKLLVIGGTQNSCFNEIKNLLWEDTNYNSSISISSVPIYHLETNTRITVNAPDADIHGDFMMTSISIPLTVNGNMSISATQVQNKL